VVGTAIALVFWHIPGFITLVATPKKALCDNEITRATNANRICVVQGSALDFVLTVGFLYVFSTHAVVPLLKFELLI
jgi:hypothetical protein